MQLPLQPSDFYATVNLQKYKILHITGVGYEAAIINEGLMHFSMYKQLAVLKRCANK
jgi:hypothetical protein